jgi:hypothetical protein
VAGERNATTTFFIVSKLMKEKEWRGFKGTNEGREQGKVIEKATERVKVNKDNRRVR